MLLQQVLIKKHKLKLLLNALWLVLLASVLVYVIWQKKPELSFSSIKLNVFYLLFALLLMPLNWLFECAKWRVVNNYNLNWNTAIRSVLAGVTTSFLFPMKTGGIIGRLVFTDIDSKSTLIKRNALNAIAQKSITVFVGLMFLFFLPIEEVKLWWFSVSIFLGIALLLILAKRYTWFTQKEIWLQLWLSLLRYTVFSIQLVLVFLSFGIEMNKSAIVFIPLFWLLVSVIPISFFGGILVRESVGVSLFGFYLGFPEMAIATSLFALWIINLLIPAILGWFVWLKRDV